MKNINQNNGFFQSIRCVELMWTFFEVLQWENALSRFKPFAILALNNVWNKWRKKNIPTRSHGSFTSESKSFSHCPVNIARASRDGEFKTTCHMANTWCNLISEDSCHLHWKPSIFEMRSLISFNTLWFIAHWYGYTYKHRRLLSYSSIQIILNLINSQVFQFFNIK